jgi:outer membrane protein
MTHYSGVLSLVVLALISVVSSANEAKFGYIDMQKAIQNTASGKKAKKELEDEFNKKKKELEKREADIKKMGEDFEKRSMAMNEEARAKKQQEIQLEMRKYQELAGKSQMDIQKRERDLTQPIVNKLKSIVDDIAQKEGYTFIFERAENSVMWAKKELDLTDRVIKEHDKK